MWRHAGLFPSEPVFVPAPDAKDEDDGVVMSVVITPREVRFMVSLYPCFLAPLAYDILILRF